MASSSYFSFLPALNLHQKTGDGALGVWVVRVVGTGGVVGVVGTGGVVFYNFPLFPLLPLFPIPRPHIWAIAQITYE